ncbi:MAG: hypothetical protein ACKVY0_18475 [Prosthecobacter sp.]|uniref:hypothetical protein n=1 Tax=Prosthecobacter sp. TaxID=1965333 RepID=UPI0039025DA8
MTQRLGRVFKPGAVAARTPAPGRLKRCQAYSADGDLIPDRIEQHYNLNPGWAGDARHDRDNNGLSNLTQYQLGIALDADLGKRGQWATA